MDIPTPGAQLGLGHRHPNADHQHRTATAAHLADEVDAEDAEDPAADQVHPGKIQEVQHARPPQAGNAAGDVGFVQEVRREHGGRMPANADPAARVLYMADSSLIGIAQQVFLNSSSLGQEMREMMEKRARKNKK